VLDPPDRVLSHVLHHDVPGCGMELRPFKVEEERGEAAARERQVL